MSRAPGPLEQSCYLGHVVPAGPEGQGWVTQDAHISLKIINCNDMAINGTIPICAPYIIIIMILLMLNLEVS